MAEKIKSADTLCVGNKYDVTTSLFFRGKENRPLMSMNISGNDKISLLKLVLVVAGVVLIISGVRRLIKNMASGKKQLEEDIPEADSRWV